MKTLRLEFEDHGFVVQFGPADEELNQFYRAAVMVYVQPHALALSLGRLSEEREREILLKAFAAGVVLDTDPKMSEREVFDFFRDHPEEFDILFSYADCRENFVDVDSVEHGEAGQTTQGD